MKNINLDFSPLYTIGENGIDQNLMSNNKDLLKKAMKDAHDFKASDLNFMNLPESRNQVEDILLHAKKLQAKFKNMVVVGIGGSSLGTEALYTSFNQRYDHEFFPGKRKLYFMDNYDSRLVEYMMDHLNLDQTVFVVISKSGGTLETMSQFFYIKDTILKDHDLDYLRERLVFVTDIDGGQLNILNKELNVQKFVIPKNVGGRFSIFTPVGLLPAAFVDIDIEAILQGAEDAVDECFNAPLEENPYLQYALTQTTFDLKHDLHCGAVLFYNDRFIKFAEWFRQLWAESLGKPSQNGPVGITPLSFRGSTDQHSQLQQLIEGKADKIYTFISFKEDGSYRFKKPELAKFDYIEGYGFNDLLNAAKVGTMRALVEVKRPVIEIKIDEFSAYDFGQLYQFFMLATALAGFIYDINPFDQPGVEQGKVYTVGELNKK